MTDIEVEIDGLPVPVDADEWATNPESVTQLVRNNRIELRKQESALKSFFRNITPQVRAKDTETVQALGFAATKSATSRTSYQGRAVNERTRQILEALNTLVRSKRYGSENSDVILVQGSFNGGGVAASAGTHDGGGAGDITAFNYKNRVKALRLLGVAAWYRPTLRNVWSAHIHFVVMGDSTVSRGAAIQVTAYKANRNGLANNAKDPDWRPKNVNITFVTNSSTGARYAAKTTNRYTQPYGSSTKIGALKKGEKFTVIAKVKNGYGNVWCVNKSGEWVDQSKLTSKAPAKPKPAPKPVPKPTPKPVAVKPVRVRLATQNFAQNNSKGMKSWKNNRHTLMSYIHKKNPHILFAQELPSTPRNYVNAKFKKLGSTLRRVTGPGSGRYIFSSPSWKWQAGGQFKPKAKFEGRVKPASWFVGLKSGRRALFVNVHPQHSTEKGAPEVRLKQIDEIVKEAKRLAKVHNVAEENIVFAGDWNSSGDVVKKMGAYGYVSAHKAAATKYNEDIRSTNGFTGESKDGAPIDMIFVHKSKSVTGYANYPHKRSDHNLILAEVML